MCISCGCNKVSRIVPGTETGAQDVEESWRVLKNREESDDNRMIIGLFHFTCGEQMRTVPLALQQRHGSQAGVEQDQLCLPCFGARARCEDTSEHRCVMLCHSFFFVLLMILMILSLLHGFHMALSSASLWSKGCMALATPYKGRGGRRRASLSVRLAASP